MANLKDEEIIQTQLLDFLRGMRSNSNLPVAQAVAWATLEIKCVAEMKQNEILVTPKP